MKPSNFLSNPMGSITRKSESETVARNIMVILTRTGDKFRLLGWGEYSTERKEDGNFTKSEQPHFNKVVAHCQSETTARLFSPVWGEVGK